MKLIMVMFDSLNRRMLNTYGCNWTVTPNFDRLANKSVVFDNCYGGSLPCMPARRELHTGRYNFLHRAWGPLEPFDDSMPQILKENGVYSHLITDHYHYFEDGGATYHTRYNSWEFIRGQEADAWKGVVQKPQIPNNRIGRHNYMADRFFTNLPYMDKEENHPGTLTFDRGIEFLETNHEEDNWFLQIENFDPHEPFYSSKKHEELYKHNYSGPDFDWPDYLRVSETDEQVEHLRNKYAALVSMCDDRLGRILDFMDSHNMWDDTMLIVCTDHGFLLGEHGWWAKNIPPYYNEVAHTPLFIWDPRVKKQGERRESLVQFIDFAPTILEYFNLPIPKDMQGRPLRNTIDHDQPVRDAGLFGIHSGHVCCTDGRHVYMRAPISPENQPIYTYTLAPMHMLKRFEVRELETMELAGPFSFTKGLQVLKMKYFGRPKQIGTIDPYSQGTLLFDLKEDPDQANPIVDQAIENLMIEKLKRLMIENDAPIDQYERLGIQL